MKWSLWSFINLFCINLYLYSTGVKRKSDESDGGDIESVLDNTFTEAATAETVKQDHNTFMDNYGWLKAFWLPEPFNQCI